MLIRKLLAFSAGLLIVELVAGAIPAEAQAPAGCFAGKKVKMIVGLGTGGGKLVCLATNRRSMAREPALPSTHRRLPGYSCSRE